LSAPLDFDEESLRESAIESHRKSLRESLKAYLRELR